MRERRYLFLLLPVCSALLFCLSPAQAQDTDPQATSQPWWNQPTLTGDWGGLRTKIKDTGITFNAHYASESAGVLASSDLPHAVRYTQQLDLETLFDLQRLVGVPDAKIQFTMTDRAGRSLTNDVLHNQFSVQELYGAGQNFRLAELNYQQSLFEQKLDIQLGWSPVGDHFANLPSFCKFQNGVICGHANAMTTNSGAQNFPTAQWGARARFNASPALYVQTGVYRVNPDAGTENHAFDMDTKGTGWFIPVELGWDTHPQTLPGTFKLGAYHNTSDTPDVYEDINGAAAGLTGAPFVQHNGRWGGYGIASQTVYRVANTQRGLRLGVMAGMGDRATARFDYFWLAGGVWQGTFPGRDQDFVSFVFADAHTNPRLTRYQTDLDSVTPGATGIQTHETITEIDYGAKITPWLMLRPNLQYVVRPGGTGSLANALVMGLYTQVTF